MIQKGPSERSDWSKSQVTLSLDATYINFYSIYALEGISLDKTGVCSHTGTRNYQWQEMTSVKHTKRTALPSNGMLIHFSKFSISLATYFLFVEYKKVGFYGTIESFNFCCSAANKLIQVLYGSNSCQCFSGYVFIYL